VDLLEPDSFAWFAWESQSCEPVLQVRAKLQAPLRSERGERGKGVLLANTVDSRHE